jgi:acetyl esterase/lipase
VVTTVAEVLFARILVSVTTMTELLQLGSTPYLDPASISLLQSFGALLDGEDLTDLSLAEAREVFDEFQGTPQPASADVRVTHHEVATSHGKVKTFVYRPAVTDEQSVPVIFYIHGGAWILGNAASYKPILFDLVERTGCAVVFRSTLSLPQRSSRHSRNSVLRCCKT